MFVSGRVGFGIQVRSLRFRGEARGVGFWGEWGLGFWVEVWSLGPQFRVQSMDAFLVSRACLHLPSPPFAFTSCAIAFPCLLN